MVEGGSGSGATNQSTGGGGGGGGGGGANQKRNRGARKRNNKRNKQNQGQKRPAAPPPPQTKLVFRNIGNAETFGSVKSVLKDLVQKVVSASNVKTVSQFVIDIDTVAFRYLIDEEEAAAKYIAEERKRLQAMKASDSVETGTATKAAIDAIPEGEENNGDTQNDNGKEDSDCNTELRKGDGVTNTANNQNGNVDLDVIVAPTSPANVPVITARPLYVNPPKKTRRRGEVGGVAYVLLTAPKLEKINSTDTSNKEGAVSTTTTAGGTKPVGKAKNDTSNSTEHPAHIAEGGEEVASTPIPEGEVAPQSKTVVDAVPKQIQTSSTAAPVPPTDYSRAIAQGRLLLSRAIDSLVDVSKDDAATEQHFAGCIIEPSMSGKTWRHQHHRSDRREGTIESTADYKNWVQSLTRQKEELKARPKPIPGGGAAAALGGTAATAAGGAAPATSNTAAAGGSSGGGGNAAGTPTGDGTTENGQPVAAIVQHLVAKRQELKRKKAKKKKEKNDKNKSKGNANSNKSGNKDGAGGGRSGGNEKGRRGEGGGQSKKKKKKGGGGGGKKGGNKSSQVAPTALLKPQKKS